MALAVAAMLLAGPPAALAHARLVRASPASQASLAGPPARIALWFSELLEDGFSSIEVVRAAEVTARPRPSLAQGTATVDPADRTLVTIAVRPLEPGDYVVEWRVLSRDGHSAAGRFTFRVQPLR